MDGNRITAVYSEVRARKNILLQRYEKTYDRNVQHIPIVFDEALPSTTVGRCTLWSNGDKLISVNPFWWEMFELLDLAKEFIIYHELC